MLIASATAARGSDPEPLEVVDSVDLERYLGLAAAHLDALQFGDLSAQPAELGLELIDIGGSIRHGRSSCDLAEWRG